jgi:DNA-binding GntR family transcriptional regulator
MNWGKQIPYYLQVAETLRRRIRDGQYQMGEFLPTHLELEKEFDVSNITIRKAISLLNEEGYLTPKRGVRAKIAKREHDFIEIELTSDFMRFSDSFLPSHLKIKVEVLEIACVFGEKRIRRMLALNPEDQVWRMKRVRNVKGRPISYIVNYGPPDLFGKIRKQDVRKLGFIEKFKDVYQGGLSRMEQRVHAIVADIDLSKLLGVDYDDPLFFVETIYYSKMSGPAAVTHAYLRGDCYRYLAITELSS